MDSIDDLYGPAIADGAFSRAMHFFTLFVYLYDRAFEIFPRLEERRRQLAGLMSGGEQQMLAVGRALMLEPRLMMIDELSLGLAPLIVQQLVQVVHDINASGVSMILVEQSANLALSVTDHAYFIEKGVIRFDGSSRELLERDDLLRSVFLAAKEGAA